MEKEAAVWLALCKDNNIPCSPVNNLKQAFEEKQAEEDSRELKRLFEVFRFMASANFDSIRPSTSWMIFSSSSLLA